MIIDHNDYESYGSGKSVKVWQRASCVAVSWYKKSGLFPLERLTEGERQGEEAWIERGDGKPPVLLQLDFTSCSWYSWSNPSVIINHVLGRNNANKGISSKSVCQSTLQCVWRQIQNHYVPAFLQWKAFIFTRISLYSVSQQAWGKTLVSHWIQSCWFGCAQVGAAHRSNKRFFLL